MLTWLTGEAQRWCGNMENFEGVTSESSQNWKCIYKNDNEKGRTQCKISFYSWKKEEKRCRKFHFEFDEKIEAKHEKRTWDFIDSPWWSEYTAAANEKFSNERIWFATNSFQSDASARSIRKSKFDVTFNFSVCSVQASTLRRYCCRCFVPATTFLLPTPFFVCKPFSVLFLFIYCGRSVEWLERRCLMGV